MEEIRKILKLLEEGKITAEEAEKLIEALEEKEKKRKSTYNFTGIGDTIRDAISSIFVFVPEVVGASISSAFSFTKREIKEVIEWKKEEPINIELSGGNINITYNEENNIIIEGEGGFLRFDNTFKIAGGDFNISIPKVAESTIRVKAGNINGKAIIEKANIELMAGDINLSLISKDINAVVRMGDLDIVLENNPENINIECKMGDVLLKLPDDFDGIAQVDVGFGNVFISKPYKMRGKEYIIGAGEKSKIKIVCRMGDIKVI
jgi:DUF4097 and DUF4098 domain-containing protein YvlB